MRDRDPRDDTTGADNEAVGIIVGFFVVVFVIVCLIFMLGDGPL